MQPTIIDILVVVIVLVAVVVVVVVVHGCTCRTGCGGCTG